MNIDKLVTFQNCFVFVSILLVVLLPLAGIIIELIKLLKTKKNDENAQTF